MEGMLHENQIDVQQLQALRQENEELQRVRIRILAGEEEEYKLI